MDSLSILLKSILQAPTDADINKVKEDLQRKLSNIKINTTSNGKGIKVLDETEIANYQKHMQNMMTNLRTKYGSLLDSGQIKKDVDMFNTAMSGMGKNGLGKKDLGLQFETLTTKVRSSSSALRLATQDADSFGSTLAKDFTKFSLWFGIGTIFMSFIHGISDAITYTNQLDNSLNEIRIVTGKTQEQVTGLANSYNKLAKEMSVTTAEIASEAANLFRQGLGESEVETRMKSIIQYAKISSISISDSDKIITATANATGESVNKIIDIFALLGDSTSSGAEEIGESLQKVASAAENSGLSLEKSSSWLSTISSITRDSASTIGRSLNSIISRYESIKSTGFNSEDSTKINDVTKSLSDLGITATDSAGQLKPIADVVDTLGTKWEGLTKNEKSYIATTMAGTFQRNKFITLMDNYGQSLINYETALNSAGTAEQKFSIYQESTAAKIDRLKASMEGFWQSSVDSGLIKGTLDSLTYLVDTFGNLQTIITISATALLLWKGSALAAALGLKSFSLATNLASSNIKLFNQFGFAMQAQAAGAATTVEALGFSFKALGASILTSMASNPLGWIAIVLTTAITLTDMYNQSQEKAAQKAEEHAQKIKDEVSALNDLKKQYTDIINSGDLTTESKTKLKGIQDKLIETYSLEKEQIDKLNGSYKEQLEVLDEVSLKKAKESLRLTTTSGENAKKYLTEKSDTNLDISSLGFRDTTKMLGLQSILDKSKTSVDSKDQQFIFSGTNEEKYQQMGDLLDGLNDKMDTYRNTEEETSVKGHMLQDTIDNLTNSYQDFKDEIEKNRSALDRYIDDKSMVDFYENYKTQISQVHELQVQLTQEKDTTKKSAIQGQIDGVKDSITSSKNYISDYKGLVIDLFKTETDSANQASEAANKATTFTQVISGLNAKLQETDAEGKKNNDSLAASFGRIEASVSDVNNAIDTLKKGEELSEDAIASLIIKHQELAGNLVLVNGVYTLRLDVLEKVRDSELQTQIDAFEAQNKIKENEWLLIKERLAQYGIFYEKLSDMTSKSLGGKISDQINNAAASGNYDLIPSLLTLKDETKTVSQYADTLSDLEKLKSNLIGKTKTGSGKPPKTPKGSNKGEASQSEALIEKDRYYLLNQELNKTNNLLEKNSALQENASYEKKVKLLDEEIKLLKQKQINIHNIAEEERKERAELVKKLSNQGVKFNGVGDNISAKNTKSILDNSLDNVNAHRNDKDKTTYNKLKSQYDSLKTSLDRFFEIQLTNLPKAGKEWIELLGDISQVNLDKISLSFEIVDEKLKDLDDELAILGNINTVDEKSKEAEILGKKFELSSKELIKIQKQIKELNKNKILTPLQQSELDMLKDREITIKVSIVKTKDDAEASMKELLELKKQIQLQEKENDYNRKLRDAEENVYGKGNNQAQYESDSKSRVDAIQSQIDALQERNSLEEENIERAKRQLELDKLRLELSNVMNNKNVQIMKQNSKTGEWNYEYTFDSEKASDLNDQINQKTQDNNQWELDLQKQKEIDLLQSAIDAENKMTEAKRLSYEAQKTVLDLALAAEKLTIETHFKNIDLLVTTEMDILKKIYGDKWGEINAEIQKQLGVAKELSSQLDAERVKAEESANAIALANAKANARDNSTVVLVDNTGDNSSTNTSASNTSSSNASTISKMKANSAAYGTASTTEKAKLASDNLSLGNSIGWDRDSSGVWRKSDGSKAYDTGGVLPSGVTAINLSGKNEQVLNPEQTKAWTQLVPNLLKITDITKNWMPNISKPNIIRIDKTHQPNQQIFQIDSLSLPNVSNANDFVNDLKNLLPQLAIQNIRK